MSGGPTKSDRGTIDMSRMAMSRRGLRLYRIGRVYCIISLGSFPREKDRVGSLLLPDLVLLSYQPDL